MTDDVYTDSGPPRQKPDVCDTNIYGFTWGNMSVVRATHITRARTTHRCLEVKTQRHRLNVYVTEARGDVRVFLDGVEMVRKS